jgi:hypothetical protein
MARKRVSMLHNNGLPQLAKRWMQEIFVKYKYTVQYINLKRLEMNSMNNFRIVN